MESVFVIRQSLRVDLKSDALEEAPGVISFVSIFCKVSTWCML